jgi:hypothetical protein
MPKIQLKCLNCEYNVSSWIEEICRNCKNKSVSRFKYPKSCRLHFICGKYVWRQHGVSCFGKPVMKTNKHKELHYDFL